jgi:hypothetical protein
LYVLPVGEGMSDHTGDATDHDHGHGHDDHGHGDEEAERVTSPMQSFTTGQVTQGAIIALVGLAITFGIPLVLL